MSSSRVILMTVVAAAVMVACALGLPGPLMRLRPIRTPVVPEQPGQRPCEVQLMRGAAECDLAEFARGDARSEEHLGAAIDAYSQALAVDPDLAAAYLGRGDAHLRLAEITAGREDDPTHHLQAALDDYTRATQLDPADAEATRRCEECQRQIETLPGG